ncbi:MAG: aminoacyl-tRNA hydrolase [Arenicellales bacterium]|jgi:PTH1 family peptidyl-tRNA hydrolase
MAAISLIIGLGNPGSGYEATRHNAGFWFLDVLARRWPMDLRVENRFRGALADLRIDSHRVRVLRPETFMNESGSPVASVANYFDFAPENILVVHDDLDLPPGSVRVKRGGGHGGHNGLRDIFSKLGSRELVRLRIGIGHPGCADEVTNYVLQKPSVSDRNSIFDAIDRAVEQLDELLNGELELAMNILHRDAKDTL